MAEPIINKKTPEPRYTCNGHSCGPPAITVMNGKVFAGVVCAKGEDFRDDCPESVRKEARAKWQELQKAKPDAL